ncbi:MAG: DegT/DnrJ/EryC1/StrS aminotransferase family protein [Kiritimatiellaeota bacterium]|nr:DegT/DnrJ/EryC1/StrS aminotransferase family protein [Kiritimatiellota bacterium]
MSGQDDFIPFFKPNIGEEEIRSVTECLRSGWLTTGKFAKTFETEFARFAGFKHAVALNSCTAALHLALEAVGLREGELVLVPTLTFAATAEVARYFNAIPVLVDSNPDDFCMDMNQAERIVKRILAGEPVKGVPERHNGPRAIIPVHYGGQTADVLKCRALCDEFDLALVEDCAHCCPAYFKDDDRWRFAGSTADIACYSFYANKNITTGEGGMALTDNEQYADRMRVMSLHGISKDAWKRFSKEGSWYYEIVAPGYKYNMPDTAAAIGVNQLKRADEFREARANVAESLTAALSGIEGLTLPSQRGDAIHSWHLYVILIDEDVFGPRGDFIERLKADGIGTSVHYLPLHMHPYYIEKYGFEPNDFPVAESLFERMVSLPIYPTLTKKRIARIADSVKSAQGAKS